jgi:hypothetical protein
MEVLDDEFTVIDELLLLLLDAFDKFMLLLFS